MATKQKGPIYNIYSTFPPCPIAVTRLVHIRAFHGRRIPDQMNTLATTKIGSYQAITTKCERTATAPSCGGQEPHLVAELKIRK